MERSREEELSSSVTDLQTCHMKSGRRRRHNFTCHSLSHICFLVPLILASVIVSRGINCDEQHLVLGQQEQQQQQHQQLHGSQAVVHPSSPLHSSPPTTNFPSTQSLGSLVDSSVTDPGSKDSVEGGKESSNGQQKEKKKENEEGEEGKKQRSYEGYTVLRLTPKSSDQLNFLQRLSVNDSKVRINFLFLFPFLIFSLLFLPEQRKLYFHYFDSFPSFFIEYFFVQCSSSFDV